MLNQTSKKRKERTITSYDLQCEISAGMGSKPMVLGGDADSYIFTGNPSKRLRGDGGQVLASKGFPMSASTNTGSGQSNKNAGGH